MFVWLYATMSEALDGVHLRPENSDTVMMSQMTWLAGRSTICSTVENFADVCTYLL